MRQGAVRAVAVSLGKIQLAKASEHPDMKGIGGFGSHHKVLVYSWQAFSGGMETVTLNRKVKFTAGYLYAVAEKLGARGYTERSLEMAVRRNL